MNCSSTRGISVDDIGDHRSSGFQRNGGYLSDNRVVLLGLLRFVKFYISRAYSRRHEERWCAEQWLPQAARRGAVERRMQLMRLGLTQRGWADSAIVGPG